MSPVARRAGLTTGAMYGRYESGGELAAAVWIERVRDRHFELLDRAIAMLVDRSVPLELDDLLAELGDPSTETIVALDVLITARRIDELEEVVLSDINQWMSWWAAGPRNAPEAASGPSRVHARDAVGHSAAPRSRKQAPRLELHAAQPAPILRTRLRRALRPARRPRCTRRALADRRRGAGRGHRCGRRHRLPRRARARDRISASPGAPDLTSGAIYGRYERRTTFSTTRSTASSPGV